jgi:hypothetical protein
LHPAHPEIHNHRRKERKTKRFRAALSRQFFSTAGNQNIIPSLTRPSDLQGIASFANAADLLRPDNRDRTGRVRHDPTIGSGRPADAKFLGDGVQGGSNGTLPICAGLCNAAAAKRGPCKYGHSMLHRLIQEALFKGI